MTPMVFTGNKQIRVAEFFRITAADNTTYLFSSLPYAITTSGMTFSGLGGYLAISQIQRDIKATSRDISLSISGIDPANVPLVLNNSKGGIVEMWRGSIDDQGAVQTISGTLQFFKRITGIITNVGVDEDWTDRDRTATCTLTVSTFRAVLDARQAGIRTNPTFWKVRYPNDVSMDRVPVIANTYFDFGKPPMKGGLSDDSNGAETNFDSVGGVTNNVNETG